jgi:flagellin FlaB
MATIKKLLKYNRGEMGIGSLIIFIAMILVSGIAASVFFQVMNTLQQQALETGRETMKDVASGLEVSHVTGKTNGDNITQLAIFTSTITASIDVDLNNAYIKISDTNKEAILYYDSDYFNNSLSNGLFSTLDLSGLDASHFGIIVIRDRDNSCSATNPVLNSQDIVALMINASNSFGNGTPSSGIETRTKMQGGVYPERGMRGVIGFTTPSTYVDTIADLQ